MNKLAFSLFIFFSTITFAHDFAQEEESSAIKEQQKKKLEVIQIQIIKNITDVLKL